MNTAASQPLREVLNRRMLICIFTGFASGMPLYVLIQLVPAWLREGGVSLAEIGLFSLVGMPYTWKFLWAPLMDRWVPALGRRRGWMIISQVALLVSIGYMGMLDPASETAAVAWLAVAVAFFSASQDIVLDAYRREILPDRELGMGNSIHITTYRISSLVPGSLSLILADGLFEWSTVFWITGAFMSVGILLSLAVSEPQVELPRRGGLRQAIVEPFLEYQRRRGWQGVLLVLAFMFLYKLGDNMATALATPFYLDIGFSKTEIGLVAKHAALWPSIAGGLVGGLIMFRIGINKALWVFGVVQVVSILGYAVLADAGAVLWLLALVIGFEYLGVGLGTAAFTAFIARETSKVHAATQIALFTALAAVPRTLANASTGFIVESVGWYQFFLLCALLALPGMVLLFWVAPFRAPVEQ